MSLEAQQKLDEIMVDFQNGILLLAMLVDWTHIEMHRQTIPAQLAAFKSAYSELLKHQNSGALNSGNVVLSEDQLALISRVHEIVKSGLTADQVQHALPELHNLTAQCVDALTPPVKP